MASNDSANAASPLHLARRALRYYPTGIVVLLLGAGATVLIARVTPQVYRSETVLLYRPNVRGESGSAEPARRMVSRLQDTLLARDRLSAVVREFKLYPEALTPEHAVELMKKNVAFRAREGSTFAISFDGEQTEQVQRVTRRLADLLIEDSSRQRKEEAEDTRRFLEREQKRLEDESGKREGELVAFLKRHPEIGAAPPMALPGQSANPGDIFNLEVTLARLRGQEAAGASSRSSGGVPSPSGRRAPTDELLALRRAEADLTAAQNELAMRRRFMKEGNPDLMTANEVVKAAEARVAKARSEAERPEPTVETPPTAAHAAEKPTEPKPEGKPGGETEAKSEAKTEAKTEAKSEGRAEDTTASQAEPRPGAGGAQGASAPRPAAGARAASEVDIIERRLSELRRTVASASKVQRAPVVPPQVDMQFQALRRALEDVRTRLAELDDRRFQAALTAQFESSGGGGQLVVIDPANLPGLPLVDKQKKVVGAGAAATLLLVMVALLIRALLDDRLYDRGDVAWMLSLPVLTVVPRAKGPRRA